MDHEIRKMLAVSSMHVSAEARLWLEGVSHLSAQGRWGGHMVAPFADGYIVYAGQGIHHDLGAVSEFAIAAGCSHIMLDNDAMPLDGFKTYEHEIGDETTLDGFPPEARAAIEAARANPEDAGIADELAEPGELDAPYPHEKPTGSGIVVPATPMEHIVVSTARLGALIDAAKAVIDEPKDDGAVDGWTALAMRLETLRAAIDDVF